MLQVGFEKINLFLLYSKVHISLKYGHVCPLKYGLFSTKSKNRLCASEIKCCDMNRSEQVKNNDIFLAGIVKNLTL